MEEEKGIDVAKLLVSEGVFWQWQSGPNPDPWFEKDATKWTWQDFSDEDCRIIEEAFSFKKEMADLGEYEIDFKKMVQVNKKLRNQIRRVRRQQNNRFMMEISEPVAFMKSQKTMNEAFGSIEHFLDYIMKRTPKGYALYQRLKDLSLDCKKSEFQDLIQDVISCVERGAEAREKMIKTRSGSQTKSFIDEAKEIAERIENNSATLRDFLKAILWVYTMETFICYWLNELLRSENWEEINVLNPYLVCLVYTFKLPEYIMKYQEPEGLFNSLLGFIVKPKLYLERGAALTKEHLELYDPKRIKYFSWNGVTSTTRVKDVALNFLRFSLKKAERLNESKVGVLFKIEADFASLEDCEGMIDISPNSASPDEQEVILAPGTVFKLLSTRMVENNIYEVNLKVTKKFENTKNNVALLGALQEGAILKDKAIIDGLPSRQSFNLLELLKGNKLIRKLDINNSNIEEHIMEEIHNLRLTTNVKREDVKLTYNTINVSSLSLLAYYFSVEKLNEIFSDNTIRFKDGGVALKDKSAEIKTLALSEAALRKLGWNNQIKRLYEKIKDASEISHLDFHVSLSLFEKTDGDFLPFVRDIKELKYLQSLRIQANEYQSMSRDGLEVIYQTNGSSNVLNQLHIGFTLSNQALVSLETALVFLGSMPKLNINPSLKTIQKTSDKALDHLKQVLVTLTSLGHLSLNFYSCNKISHEGLQHLKTALIKLTSLQSLSLNFSWCKEFSDKALNHLTDGLKALTSIQYLTLNFENCDKISDQGFNHLGEALKPLTSLRHLDLNFNGCKEISEEGLNHRKGGLMTLIFLQYLSLSFEGCEKISDEALKYLIQSSTCLLNLTLNFNQCTKISDEGLKHLKDGLIPLTSLQYIDLRFEKCSKISNEGLDHIKDGLKALTSLQYLGLSVENCDNISDQGLYHLKDGLKGLVALQHSSLNFTLCSEISDKGLNYLTSGLKNLTSLKHLTLNFKGCDITNEGRIYFFDQLHFIRDLSCLR